MRERGALEAREGFSGAGKRGGRRRGRDGVEGIGVMERETGRAEGRWVELQDAASA